MNTYFSQLLTPIAGVAYAFLFIHFIFRNLRYGSSRFALVDIKDALKESEQSWLFRLLVVHLQNWYIILFQIIIAFLLIITPPGRDVINYLAEVCNDGIIKSVLQIVAICGAVFLYSMAIWVIPWHLLDDYSQKSIRGNLLELRSLRVLGLMTYPTIMVGVLAASKNGPDFNGGPYLWAIILLYISYWVLYRIFHAFTNTLDENPPAYDPKEKDYLLQKDKTNIFINNFFWGIIAIGGVGSLAMAGGENTGTKILLLGTTFFFGLLYWYITSPGISDCDNKHQRGNWFNLIKCRLVRAIRNWLLFIDEKSNPVLARLFRYRSEGTPYEPMLPVSERLRRNRAMYRILMFSSFFIAYACALLPNLQAIPPFITVFSGVGFILMIIDFMFYTGRRVINTYQNPGDNDVLTDQSDTQKHLSLLSKYKAWVNVRDLPAFVIWCFLWVYLMFSTETSEATVHPIESGVTPKRVTVSEYLDMWVKERKDEFTDTSDYKVFLFAGEGGGSRAGYWTSAALTLLEDTFAMDIKRHTLAISAVSGSAPGALATLAWWETDSIHRPRAREYCRYMYGRNFVTGGISGNIYGDLIRKFWPFVSETYIKNRNRRLCEEESWGISQSLLGKAGSGWLTESLYCSDQYGWQPFSRHYEENGKWHTDLPLFLPNTTHVQSGRRGIISPVIDIARDSNTFMNVIDLYGRIKDNLPKHELTAVEAANLAELFPYVSAAANIPGLGMYVDGGYYENFGISTIFEIYNACKAWQDDTTQVDASIFRYKKRIKFYVVSIINDAYDDEKIPLSKINLEDESPNQFVAPAIAIYKTPFAGHAETKRVEIKNKLAPKKEYFEIRLDKEGLPLTRVLTSQNITDMDIEMTKAIGKFLEQMK